MGLRAVSDGRMARGTGATASISTQKGDMKQNCGGSRTKIVTVRREQTQEGIKEKRRGWQWG